MINDSMPTVKPGDAIKAEHYNALTKAIKARTPRPSDTVSVRNTANGFVMEAASGGGAMSTFRGAWAPTVSSDQTSVTLTAGSINDGTQTWLPDVTDIELVPNALNYIYLKCQLNPTTEDSFVTGGDLSSAVILATSSTQTNSNTYGYILLATVDLSGSGTVTRYAWFNFSCQLRNQGVGDVRFHYWYS